MATNTAELAADSPLSKISLGIVCPMANEQATAVSFVNAVLKECSPYGFKSVTFFAILDSKSNDRTRELLDDLQKRQPDLQVVWAPENRCVVDAYVAGYRQALMAGSDWVLEIDAGFSHQPSDMPKFFKSMLEGYDCVFGSRFCREGRITDSSLKRYVLSRTGTLLANTLLGTKLTDMTSGFELFSGRSLQHVLDRGIRSRGPFFQTEIKTYCRHFRTAEAPIHYRGASHSIGSSALKDSFSNLWRLFRLRLQGQL